MKFKTTTKAIKAQTLKEDLLCVGYCDLQTLLRNHEPIAYTCGVYGWNYDVYIVDGKTICTGYRGMPGRRANNVDEYEKRARAIMDEYKRNYEERSDEVEKLLHEFIAQA